MEILVLIFPILLSGAGIWFITRGRFGRRVGDVPHCRKCDYVLTGNETGRCPECGSLLTSLAVVYGQRPRRPRSLLMGVVLLLVGGLIAASIIVASVMKVDWYRYRPTSWVIRDLDSPTPAKADQAWIELKRRIAAGGISAANEHALIERALREQQALSNGFMFSNELVDYLGPQYIAHHMGAGEIQRFFDTVMKLNLEVRPSVGPTDPIAYRIGGLGRGPSGWHMRRAEIGFWIDDKKIERGRSSGDGGFGGMSWSSTMQPQSIGMHRLRIEFELSAFRGALPSAAAAIAEQSRKVELTAPFAVTAKPPAIVLLTDPSAAAVRACFGTYGFRRTADSTFEGMIQASNPPVAMAFNVFARMDGREYPMGNVYFDKAANTGMSWGINSGKIPPGPAGTIDVILRSSEQAAIQTPDMTQIWKGEIIIPGVAIQQPPTSKP